MRAVAGAEGVPLGELVARIAAGTVVIPKNAGRGFTPRGIGKGLSTKVNANIGTSPLRACPSGELEKLDAAVKAGADAVMDLSTGGDLPAMLNLVLEKSPLPVGTVPLYAVTAGRLARGLAPAGMDPDTLFGEIERQAKAGVDFMTLHCGVTRAAMATLDQCGRVMGMVSRGGSLMAEWMAENGQENPLYEKFDWLLEICREHDVTISLGDGLRPGAVHDADDRAQTFELVLLGELAARANKAGVQAMIEGPGHVPLSRVASNVALQKRLCGGAPYYVLGPLPTDIAPGYDHIVSAIGGAIAAAAGADFLCYVTPAEHLSLPTAEEVREGVVASRIAAHVGDIEKGLPGAWERNLEMSRKRALLDWEGMFALALDPARARARRGDSGEDGRGVCAMCGEMCAVKSHARAREARERKAGGRG